MIDETGVDGVMVSRGALGNPWIFREIKQKEVHSILPLEEWIDGVFTHMKWQQEAYGGAFQGTGLLCMRKHLLWYLKGMRNSKAIKEKLLHLQSWYEIEKLFENYFNELISMDIKTRELHFDSTPVRDRIENEEAESSWDPKYDMDRKLDRGVGDDFISDESNN